MACVTLLMLAVTMAADRPMDKAELPWHDAASPLRVVVEIASGDVARHDRPAEIELNFTQIAKATGQTLRFDPKALQAVEVTAAGEVRRGDVPLQFDKAETFDAATNAAGTVTLILEGRMAKGAVRRFVVYFGGKAREQEVRPLVKVEDDVDHQGQTSYRVTTPGATYLYHKQGAGFASLIDGDGNDWISYRPGGGSAGEYRGIPNLCHPEGYFHPGGTKCTSRLLSRGPMKVSIASASRDKAWACRWDIFPAFARLTVTRAPKPYWFLYEGTPGGKLEWKTDFCVRPPRRRSPVSKRWTETLGDPEWVAFGDGELGRVLYLAHHQADKAVDSYWPMQGNMTVFGFGRNGLKKFMTAVPNRFTIGLAPAQEFPAAMNSAYRDLAVEVGPCQKRPAAGE